MVPAERRVAESQADRTADMAARYPQIVSSTAVCGEIKNAVNVLLAMGRRGSPPGDLVANGAEMAAGLLIALIDHR